MSWLRFKFNKRHTNYRNVVMFSTSLNGHLMESWRQIGLPKALHNDCLESSWWRRFTHSTISDTGMKSILLLLFSLEINADETCQDNPLFKSLCTRDRCQSREERRLCERTCSQCTGARSNQFGNSLYEEGAQCEHSVTSILKCQHHCRIENNRPTCSCLPGYVLNNDKTTCRDVNECRDLNPCPSYESCVNHAGGYTCQRKTPQPTCATGEKRNSFGGCCKEKNTKCGRLAQHKPFPERIVNQESPIKWSWLVYVLGNWIEPCDLRC